MASGSQTVGDLIHFKVTCLEPAYGTSCAIDFNQTNLMLEVLLTSLNMWQHCLAQQIAYHLACLLPFSVYLVDLCKACSVSICCITSPCRMSLASLETELRNDVCRECAARLYLSASLLTRPQSCTNRPTLPYHHATMHIHTLQVSAPLGANQLLRAPRLRVGQHQRALLFWTASTMSRCQCVRAGCSSWGSMPMLLGVRCLSWLGVGHCSPPGGRLQICWCLCFIG